VYNERFSPSTTTELAKEGKSWGYFSVTRVKGDESGEGKKMIERE